VRAEDRRGSQRLAAAETRAEQHASLPSLEDREQLGPAMPPDVEIIPAADRKYTRSSSVAANVK
jgi:hypothetical protein